VNDHHSITVVLASDISGLQSFGEDTRGDLYYKWFTLISSIEEYKAGINQSLIYEVSN